MTMIVAVAVTGQRSQMHTCMTNVVLLTFLGELDLTSGSLEVVMLLFLAGHIVIGIEFRLRRHLVRALCLLVVNQPLLHVLSAALDRTPLYVLGRLRE